MVPYFVLILVLAAVWLCFYNKIPSKAKFLCISLIMASLLSILIVSSCGTFTKTENMPVTVTALGSNNEKAKGHDAQLLYAVVDGKQYSISDPVKGHWVSENGNLTWRTYNVPSNMTDTIILNIPVGKHQELVFNSNAWSGKIQIVSNGTAKTYDLYSDTTGWNFYQAKLSELPDSLLAQAQYTQRINMIKQTALFFVLMIVFSLLGVLISKRSWKKVNIEDNLLHITQKHLLLISVICITLLAIAVRFVCRNYLSGDFVYYQNWFNVLKQSGGLPGLRYSFAGSYNEAYMVLLALLTYLPIKPLYSIKLLSILFDFLGAVCAAFIVMRVNKKSGNCHLYGCITYGIVLFLPTVIMNSSYWAQCDMIYTTCILSSLYMLIREKYKSSFTLLGLAISFKFQTFLFLPVYIILYFINRKIKIHYFLIPVIVYFSFCMPGLIAGRSLQNILTSPLHTINGITTNLTGGFDNFYMLVLTNDTEINGILRKVGILLTFLLIGLTILLFLYKKICSNKENIISLFLFYIVLCTYFLPGMHERYLFSGDVLSVIYFIARRNYKEWFIPASINLFSILSSLRYITAVWPGNEYNILTEINGLTAVVYFFFVVYLLIHIYLDLTKDDAKCSIQKISVEEKKRLNSKRL